MRAPTLPFHELEQLDDWQLAKYVLSSAVVDIDRKNLRRLEALGLDFGSGRLAKSGFDVQSSEAKKALIGIALEYIASFDDSSRPRAVGDSSISYDLLIERAFSSAPNTVLAQQAMAVLYTRHAEFVAAIADRMRRKSRQLSRDLTMLAYMALIPAALVGVFIVGNMAKNPPRIEGGITLYVPARESGSPYLAVIEPRLRETSPRVVVGDGFFTEVRFLTGQIGYEDGTAVPEYKRLAAEREVRAYLARHLRATFVVAGMNVEPKGPASLSHDLTARWSVSPISVGRFTGILKTSVVAVETSADSSVAVPIPNDVVIHIPVEEKSSLREATQDVSTLVTWLVAYTVIAAFVWAWRDRRSKRLAETQKVNEPLIKLH